MLIEVALQTLPGAVAHPPEKRQGWTLALNGMQQQKRGDEPGERVLPLINDDNIGSVVVQYDSRNLMWLEAIFCPLYTTSLTRLTACEVPPQ